MEAETVIIASGAGHRHLGLESEYLLEKKGVTYCATCDGALPMFRNSRWSWWAVAIRPAKKRLI